MAARQRTGLNVFDNHKSLFDNPEDKGEPFVSFVHSWFEWNVEWNVEWNDKEA